MQVDSELTQLVDHITPSTLRFIFTRNRPCILSTERVGLIKVIVCLETNNCITRPPQLTTVVGEDRI